MSKYLEKSRELRAIAEPHYNCAQGVLVPFAPDAGLSEEQAYLIAGNFGAGMKMGSVCGAVTGGLMTLGLYGITDSQAVSAYYRAFRRKHGECLDCAELLRKNKETGTPKKTHCDEMVFESVQIVEQILREYGKI